MLGNGTTTYIGWGWKTLTLDKSLGGAGIINIFEWHDAIIRKQAFIQDRAFTFTFRVNQNPAPLTIMLWERSLRSKYGFESWLHTRKYKHKNCSSFWKLLCKMGPSIIPHIRVLVHDGKSTSTLNDCWIPGSVLSRSAFELDAKCGSQKTSLHTFIEEGRWNHHRLAEDLGPGISDMLSLIPIDCSLEKDSYVWGLEHWVNPKIRQVLGCFRPPQPPLLPHVMRIWKVRASPSAFYLEIWHL